MLSLDDTISADSENKANGARFISVTIIVVLLVSVSPSSSMTVKFTMNVPFSGYSRWIVTPDPVFPFPKSHM